LTEDSSQWQTIVNTVMKQKLPEEAGDIIPWKMLYHGVVTLTLILLTWNIRWAL